MRAHLLTSFFTIALITSAGSALAQETKGAAEGPPPAQSAPAQSSHASGHDAQTGKPETGELQNTAPQTTGRGDKAKIDNGGGAATQRLDVSPSGFSTGSR